jgi:hypothetical protein
MPLHHCLPRFTSEAMGLAGQHREQLRQRLDGNDHLIGGELLQNGTGRQLPIDLIHPLGMHKDVGVQGDPHRSAIVEVVATPGSNINRPLTGKSLHQPRAGLIASRIRGRIGDDPGHRLPVRRHDIGLTIPHIPEDL